MPVLEVFDRPLCCATGVCGVDVDQALVTFAADLDWVRSQGAPVTRANLAQQPLEFAQRPPIRHLLETDGEKALPAVLVDGELKSSGRYPSRDELAGWAGLNAAPSLFTEQVAELVAIGAAIASNCEPCFRFHYDTARKLGVTDADVRRAVDLAQKVKETPARAVLNLAHRSLDKKDGLNAIGVATATPSKAGACCAPAEAVARAASTSKCC
jgi:AhpD family alkylhydroperoxidase